MCWTSFSDTTTPGRPRNTTKVRVVCDKANLYVAFDCKELIGIKATATGQYDEKVPQDDHVSIVLLLPGHRWVDSKHPSVPLLIKVNPRGATWARKYGWLGGDARPGSPIKIEGLAAAGRVSGARGLGPGRPLRSHHGLESGHRPHPLTGGGQGGRLFVFTGGMSVDHGWANSSICIYDRSGRYLKQIYPFPGNLPAEKMAGIRPIALGGRGWLPSWPSMTRPTRR